MEILAINPKRKKTKKQKSVVKKRIQKKNEVSKMAKKKTRKRRRKTNPSAKKVARRAGSRVKSSFLGLNLGTAFKGTVPRLAGALAAQWGAKKFSDHGGANDPDWEGKNYLIGAASAFAAGMISENIKRGTGQKVLEGGLLLLGYKLFTNEIAPKNEWLDEQFGAEEEDQYLLGDGNEQVQQYNPGDGYLADDGETYVMGADRRWYPTSDAHRQIEGGEMGDTLAPASTLGDTLAPASTLGIDDPYAYALHDGGSSDPYSEIFNR